MLINKKLIPKIINLIDKSIKNPRTSLIYKNNFTLLISVLLSAQCTDLNVNKITKNIYNKYYLPKHFVNIGEKKIKNLIKSIGLFNTKAKNIYNLSKILIKEYNSKIPNSFEKLIKLPGVGRKTANVVLNEAFGKPTVAVDTHVFRVSKRIGLSNKNYPEQVEKDLLEVLPKKTLKKAHHLLLLHGRHICKSRNPLCSKCVVNNICTFNKN